MQLTDNIYAQTREDARTVWFLGVAQAIRAVGEQTKGGYALFEQLLPPGVGMPLHIHHNEDETIFVIEGSLTVFVGSERIDAPTGTVVFAPKDIPHAFRNDGNVMTRVQLLANPAGFEGFIFGSALDEPPPAMPDLEHVIAVGAKFGVEILRGKPYPDSV